MTTITATAGGLALHDPRPEPHGPGLVLVIPCSRRKLDRPAPAGLLYTGQLYRDAAAAASSAEALALRAGIPTVTRILSGRWGLVNPCRVLDPYDVKLGDPDAVRPEVLARQVGLLTAGGAAVAVALTPKSYTAAVREVWPGALVAPLDGSPGIGVHKARLAAIARQPGPLVELVARELVRP